MVIHRLLSLESQFRLHVLLDSVGLPDYALWSAGGRVVRDLTSATYLDVRSFMLWRFTISAGGTSLYPPELALSADMQPGRCWPMDGPRGTFAVKLARPIIPMAVTIEHIPKEIAFHHSTAPKNVEVWGVPHMQYMTEADRPKLERVTVRTGFELAESYQLPIFLRKHSGTQFVYLGNITYDVHSMVPTQTTSLCAESEEAVHTARPTWPRTRPSQL